MKNILIVCSHDAALREYISVFADQSLVKPVFYFNYTSRFIDLLESKSIEYVQIGGGGARAGGARHRLIKRFIDDTWFGCALQTFVLFDFLKLKVQRALERQTEQFLRLIESESITSIVVQNDRSVGIEAAAINAARQKGLNAVVLAFAYSADHQSSFKLRQSKIYRCNFRQPEQVLYVDKEFGRRGFFRPFESRALMELGLLPVNPWVLGGSGSAAVLVEGERERRRLISLGGDKANYFVTGLASHDQLHTAWAMAKGKRRGKKTIAVALPQYWEHNLASKAQHFEHLEGLLTGLRDLRAEILVSLHPKMCYADYEYMNKEFGVRITDKPLWEIVPNSDLLICTFSSTVAWALLCAKQVIIVDHVGLNIKKFYDEFKIPICTSNVNVRRVASVMLNQPQDVDPDFSPLIRDLSPFDGKCRDRILSVFQ